MGSSFSEDFLGHANLGPGALAQESQHTSLEKGPGTGFSRELGKVLSWRILESLQEGVCAVDSAGRLHFMNAAAEQLLGLSSEELQGHLVHRLIPLETLGLQPFPGEHSVPVEHSEVRSGRGAIFSRGTGDTFVAEWRVMPILDNPAFRGAIIVFGDITQQLDMEKNILENQMLFERAFNDATIAKAIVSLDGRFLDVNPFFCELLGYERSVLLNKHFIELTHPDDIRHSLEALKSMAIEQCETIHFQKRYIHRNGNVIRLSLTSSLVRDHQGQPRCLYAQLQDITPLSEMEEALWQSQERFRRAFKDAAIGMAIVSLDELYLEINPELCRMLGYSQAELLAQPTWLFAHPEDHKLELVSVQRMKSGEQESCAYEKRYFHRNGQVVWANVTASNVRDEAGQLQYFVRQVQDITDRKLADEQLRKAREDAERAATVKAEFLAVVSHEVRTPMNAVLGMASLLEATDLTSHQRELVETIKNSGNTLMAMMNDILDYSKIESGKMELELHPFALPACVEEVWAMFRPLATGKGLDLTLQVSESIPPVVLGDSKRLMQILINLIGNALKFTDDGYVAVSVEAAGFTSQHELLLHFQVSDTGCGIPHDKLQVIFDFFTQAAPATFRHYGGSGLGLAICHRLIQLMRGHIEVESTPGQGSTFHFTIPVLSFEGMTEALPRTRKPSQSAFDASLAERAPLRILVAEDNQVNQKLMTCFMEALGYSVIIVSNGLEVLEALQAETFDLILMDVQMPLMDGLETSRQINERYGPERRPRIIALTAFGSPEDRTICLEAGMDDYLAKPIHIERLERMLEHTYQWQKVRKSWNTQTSVLWYGLPPTSQALVNIAQLMNRLAVQPEQLKELIELFAEEGAELLVDLQQALDEGSTEKILRHLHQMKGACLALCADGLKQQISNLEARVKVQGLQPFTENWENLQAGFRAVLTELRQALVSFRDSSIQI